MAALGADGAIVIDEANGAFPIELLRTSLALNFEPHTALFTGSAEYTLSLSDSIHGVIFHAAPTLNVISAAFVTPSKLVRSTIIRGGGVPVTDQASRPAALDTVAADLSSRLSDEEIAIIAPEPLPILQWTLRVSWTGHVSLLGPSTKGIFVDGASAALAESIDDAMSSAAASAATSIISHSASSTTASASPSVDAKVKSKPTADARKAKSSKAAPAAAGAGSGPFGTFVGTLCEPHLARFVMPCWDDFRFRAPLTLTVTIPTDPSSDTGAAKAKQGKSGGDSSGAAGWVAVGNGPLRTTKTSAATVEFSFSATTPLPMYLFGFALFKASAYDVHVTSIVGRLEGTSDVTARCLVYAPTSLGAAGGVISRWTAIAAAYGALIFGCEAASSKGVQCDVVIVPKGFPIGGMENTSIIYISESSAVAAAGGAGTGTACASGGALSEIKAGGATYTPTAVTSGLLPVCFGPTLQAAAELCVHEVIHQWVGCGVGLSFRAKEGITMALERAFVDALGAIGASNLKTYVFPAAAHGAVNAAASADAFGPTAATVSFEVPRPLFRGLVAKGSGSSASADANGSSRTDAGTGGGGVLCVRSGFTAYTSDAYADAMAYALHLPEVASSKLTDTSASRVSHALSIGIAPAEAAVVDVLRSGVMEGAYYSDDELMARVATCAAGDD